MKELLLVNPGPSAEILDKVSQLIEKLERIADSNAKAEPEKLRSDIKTVGATAEAKRTQHK